MKISTIQYRDPRHLEKVSHWEEVIEWWTKTWAWKQAQNLFTVSAFLSDTRSFTALPSAPLSAVLVISKAKQRPNMAATSAGLEFVACMRNERSWSHQGDTSLWSTTTWLPSGGKIQKPLIQLELEKKFETLSFFLSHQLFLLIDFLIENR